MIRRLFSLGLVLVLLGCATPETAPSFDQAPIPKARQDVAVLYIFRQSAVPLAFPGYVEIDDQRVAELQQRGFTWVYVKPGTRNLKHSWPLLAAMPRVSFTRDFVAGQTYVLELKGTFERDTREKKDTFTTAVQSVGFAEARARMQDCCRFTVPAGGAIDY